MPYLQAFDPVESTSKPAHWDECPHRKKTRAGVPPEQPLLPHQEFLEGPFPHTHVPEYRFFSNLNAAQIQAVRQRGTQILAIIPHGGGQGLLKRAKVVASAIESFLRSLAFESNGRKAFNVKVYEPEVKKMDPNNPFGKPHAFFVDLGPNADALRKFLLWQEVFAVNPSLSFSVLPVDTREASWKVCVITGDDIEPNATHAYLVQQRTLLLTELKKRIHDDFKLLWKTAQLVLNSWNVHGTYSELATMFTDTFMLELTTADPRSGAPPAPAFILYAKPLTYDKREAVKWRADFLRVHPRTGAQPLRLGLDIFPVDKGSVDCKVCKADVHRTADCPLANTPGWIGVTPELIGKDDKETAGREAAKEPGAQNPVDAAQDIFRTVVKRKKRTSEPNPSGVTKRGGRTGRGGRGSGGFGAWAK
ncbi:hypothetical protein L226DRAFT_466733 [Lentinus tigrinus ALCF2SS1-7]|uniref:Uncharacterized protein n=1 Tax=Lentinus tigrinus ALCF2SS1-6 TaxID=1328759 RepID=A0A5C2RWJ2_9APHY|nr:hypothetical protein L227DRAFT_509699 [Lentinus tigrinus ALCF2SS1-6]RPD72561.1 hypothetical protein L226DRAFT_466733 [Lentinus tigrinus ALCF2SS1-7]